MATGPWQTHVSALGAYIRSQRQLASMSLRELADVAQVSNAYLSQLERGLHEPSLRVVKAIADALQVSTESLLSQSGLLDSAADDDGETAKPASTESAIQGDPKLTNDEKDALLSVYRSYLARRTTKGR